MPEGSQPDQPGVFYSFETLFQQLSTKLDSTMGMIQTELAKLNTKLDSKASKDSLDALERRMHAEFKVVNERIDKQGATITDMRIAEAGPRATSKLQMAVFVLITGFVFTLISTLIYVVAKGHG